jgi:primosomal protein N' (replication factor Y)
LFADVVFNRPIEPLTYEVPEGLTLVPGVRVRVPLRRGQSVGIVYRLKPESALTLTRPVAEVLDDEPLLTGELIELGEWISRYYLCSIGEALWTIIPKGYRGKRGLKRAGATSSARANSFTPALTLTGDQERVFDQLLGSLKASADEPGLPPLSCGAPKDAGARHFLLHGVTGSGKTEIYLRIIHETLKMGLGSILLVPEISLTPQTVEYFSRRIGDALAILHSRLTKAEKLSEWSGILSGEKRIVIGARSAIFAPMSRLGVIIVDEEHETSYKSDETPRYSAKSVAAYRAQKHGSTLLLGSATPSVEAYYLAKMGKLTLLSLPSRVLNQKLPETRIADLRKVKGEKYVSGPLFKAIARRLKNSEQVILFLNRRGYAPFVSCENCGFSFKCRNCDITLTYHKNEKRLRCHYCGYTEDLRDTCPECGDERISYAGFGTEKVEKVLNDYYPGAVVVRMDSDSVKRRSSISQILSAFAKKQIDILVGTQMVTKGLHFPDVTLVGVLNADIPLNFPDFRAAERTFNLITQVSGRAGRSEKGGEVVIQTYNPAHYAIQTAKNQDYEEFFVREMRYRENLVYPPFCRIVRLVFRGPDSKRLFEQAYRAVSFIQEKTKEYIALLGPAYCPLSRIKNNYRVHVIVKMTKMAEMRRVLAELQEGTVKKREAYLEIDIDPLSML